MYWKILITSSTTFIQKNRISIEAVPFDFLSQLDLVFWLIPTFLEYSVKYHGTRLIFAGPWTHAINWVEFSRNVELVKRYV